MRRGRDRQVHDELKPRLERSSTRPGQPSSVLRTLPEVRSARGQHHDPHVSGKHGRQLRAFPRSDYCRQRTPDVEPRSDCKLHRLDRSILNYGRAARVVEVAARSVLISGEHVMPVIDWHLRDYAERPLGLARRGLTTSPPKEHPRLEIVTRLQSSGCGNATPDDRGSVRSDESTATLAAANRSQGSPSPAPTPHCPTGTSPYSSGLRLAAALDPFSPLSLEGLGRRNTLRR
jgi:hypothetical protein